MRVKSIFVAENAHWSTCNALMCILKWKYNTTFQNPWKESQTCFCGWMNSEQYFQAELTDTLNIPSRRNFDISRRFSFWMRVTLRTASISLHWKNSCEKMEMLCFGFEGYVVFGFFLRNLSFSTLKRLFLGLLPIRKIQRIPRIQSYQFS